MMEKLGLELGKNFLKSQFGGGGGGGGHHSSSSGSGGYGGGRMTTSEFMREAKKFASSKGNMNIMMSRHRCMCHPMPEL